MDRLWSSNLDRVSTFFTQALVRQPGQPKTGKLRTDVLTRQHCQVQYRQAHGRYFQQIQRLYNGTNSFTVPKQTESGVHIGQGFPAGTRKQTVLRGLFLAVRTKIYSHFAFFNPAHPFRHTKGNEPYRERKGVGECGKYASGAIRKGSGTMPASSPVKKNDPNGKICLLD